MTWIYITIGGLLVIGGGIAIYERRRGRPFQIEHLDEDGNPDADRELTRISDEVQNRSLFKAKH
tara:strand:+ start:806 stop:997 length:192 start_codon:yes stop_codon:yes gene_type:complete